MCGDTTRRAAISWFVLPRATHARISASRAVTVVRYLQGKGVTPAMLGAAGFSEYRPVAPNDNAQNRSRNRRIEIALTAAEPVQVVDTPK